MDASPQTQPNQPSGDALFDAYSALTQARWPEARAVYEEHVEYLIAWHGLENLRARPGELARALTTAGREGMPLSQKNHDLWARLQRAMEPELLSIAELRSLEPGFAGDPRYWQLLHWAGRQRRMDPEVNAWELQAEAYEVLIEARERGAVDGATLLLLVPLLEAAGDTWPQRQFELQGEILSRMAQEAQQARRQGSRPIPPPARHELAYFEEQGARARALAGRLGLGLPQLYRAAVELSPDWAQIHYQHALYLHQRGQQLAAYHALKQGNSAARQRLLKSYPQSLVRELALRGEIAGSAKLFWDIEMHSITEHEPALFVGLRGLPAAVAAELPPGERLDPSTQLLHLLALSGTAELASGFECQIASIALSKLLDSALRFLAEHGGDSARLVGPQNLAERLRTAVVNALQQSSQPSALALSDEQMREIDSFKLDWDSQRSAMEPLYRLHFEQLVSGFNFAREALWPLLREVQRIDLKELAGA